MPYCSRCGVEVEEQTLYCPLCRAPIQMFTSDGEIILPSRPPYTDTEVSRARKTTKERREAAIKILTAINLIPLLITSAIDLILNSAITWSSYSTIAILFIWSCSVIPLFFYKHPFIIILCYFIATSGLQLGIGFFLHKFLWFSNFGLPISLTAYAIITFIVYAGSKAKHRGFNIAAYILMGIVFLCIAIENITHSITPENITFSWSAIVLATLLPFILLFLYLHFIRRKKVDLKKWFHI